MSLSRQKIGSIDVVGQHRPPPIALTKRDNLGARIPRPIASITDQGGERRLVQRFFSGGFRRATATLRRSGFPVDELRRLQDRQDEREANPVSPRRNPAAALRRLASPTAAATAMFFAHGARAVGRPEAPEVAPAMRRLGYDFGRLVYLLDGEIRNAPQGHHERDLLI